jgi:hypothetical protein
MSNVRIGPTGASTVGRLLREIGHGRGLPTDLRDDANQFAASVRRKMDRRDVERVAWLLWNVSSTRSWPSSRREQARYWATFLEGRL